MLAGLFLLFTMELKFILLHDSNQGSSLNIPPSLWASDFAVVTSYDCYLVSRRPPCGLSKLYWACLEGLRRREMWASVIVASAPRDAESQEV